MSDVTYEQTLALAGICQAGSLIQQLARTGRVDMDKVAETFTWVLNTNPASTEDVFGSEKAVEQGFTIIHDQLGHKSHKKDAELTRYVLSLLSLERKLAKNKLALQRLAKGIDNAERQLTHYEITDEQIITSLAGLYSDVISPLGPKIQIIGNPHLLQQKSVQNKIRAILLAGMRAAVLWRQLGGKRRNIVFRRNKWVSFSAQALHKFNQIN
ncbi:lysogenization regulator HflD [Saccharobesus litoralis]|uniref:High frequency lysogenization protein HflD homolog n=1 Tax=Saccharobesus litoralis TaxID=2172099 RepID=A0A2S0VT14_9ALTE|nr:high frequency lysogenization protein HflD [Saccharobesus litoralis]AWB67322.1 lysogenization regulator HflD [Saccharobesus litoralis]